MSFIGGPPIPEAPYETPYESPGVPPPDVVGGPPPGAPGTTYSEWRTVAETHGEPMSGMPSPAPHEVHADIAVPPPPHGHIAPPVAHYSTTVVHTAPKIRGNCVQCRGSGKVLKQGLFRQKFVKCGACRGIGTVAVVLDPHQQAVAASKIYH
eukprot:TRINITY_DN26815_c0_g1_i1.p1 TRINITY_DN26815_c0_g1~~TRINITY_DN26815_c0_g1_i1.p1  ORF type:complete len:152 (-),score=9.88 TRINITY_DN26815_c0_g1_i1:224-679(-)